MPAITRINDEKRYNELLNARRTSVIEAAKLVYQTQQWIDKRELELKPISDFKLDMESQVAAGTTLIPEIQDIVNQQKRRIQELNEFKGMLEQFTKNIHAYNALQQPAELKWYSNNSCYYPHALVSVDDKFLSHWYILHGRRYMQQGCDVSGAKFYASLRKESYLARSDTSSIFSREDLAVAGVMLGGILLFTGLFLGLIVNPLFLILMVVGIALMIYSGIALHCDDPHPPLVADNYIEHETPVVSVDELEHILQTGRSSQEMLPAHAISSEPSAPPLQVVGIFSHTDEYRQDDVRGEPGYNLI
ncbi:MAG: hypothetical protein P1U39_05600 [Legionellaceae bacterium]|nr:hypothetical protein [Legionellaceae bacterium]